MVTTVSSAQEIMNTQTHNILNVTNKGSGRQTQAQLLCALSMDALYKVLWLGSRRCHQHRQVNFKMGKTLVIL